MNGLNELPVGSRAKVAAITLSGGMRRRLIDMGLIEGTTVECVGKSPLGDPKAYLIRGTVIALRAEDASKVSVTENRRERPADDRSAAILEYTEE